MRGTTLGFLIAGLLLAAPSSAQQPEVHVDPDSPAGVEYAIPLEKARREAAGEKGAPGKRGGDSRQLFGAGIQKQEEPSEPAEPAAPEPAEEPAEETPAEPAPAEAPKDKPDRAKKKQSKGQNKQEDTDSEPAAASSASDDSDPPQKSVAAVEAASSDDGSTNLAMGGIAAGVLAFALLTGFGLRRLFRSA